MERVEPWKSPLIRDNFNTNMGATHVPPGHHPRSPNDFFLRRSQAA